jgi:2-polyprenyl-3-methyl-5-hydroxy-6-metoxy-1,4-benzoquinol methylase
MKLVNEHLKSYIDDIRQVGLLKLLTWQGRDVAFAWIGPHEPATNSDDHELAELARCNRVHYVFYRTLLQCYVEMPDANMLDVGCGSGQRTAMLARYARAVTAIDSDVMKASVGSVLNGAMNIRYVIGDFLPWAAKDPWRYDAIFAVEVIEHVPQAEQQAFVEAMVAKLAPGGVLMLTTPRDVPPVRVAPHIGLWDDEMAAAMATKFGGTPGFFSREVAEATGSAFCRPEEATHYTLVIRAPEVAKP